MDGFDGSFELVPMNIRHVGVDDFAIIPVEALFTDLNAIVQLGFCKSVKKSDELPRCQ